MSYRLLSPSIAQDEVLQTIQNQRCLEPSKSRISPLLEPPFLEEVEELRRKVCSCLSTQMCLVVFKSLEDTNF